MVDKSPKRLPAKFKTFCGMCGRRVKFTRKSVVKLYQITRNWEKEKIKKFQVYVAYRCLDDGVVTEFDYFVKDDMKKFIEQFNLYTRTRAKKK